jgi:hypothetical protein
MCLRTGGSLRSGAGLPQRRCGLRARSALLHRHVLRVPDLSRSLRRHSGRRRLLPRQRFTGVQRPDLSRLCLLTRPVLLRWRWLMGCSLRRVRRRHGWCRRMSGSRRLRRELPAMRCLWQQLLWTERGHQLMPRRLWLAIEKPAAPIGGMAVAEECQAAWNP